MWGPDPVGLLDEIPEGLSPWSRGALLSSTKWPLEHAARRPPVAQREGPQLPSPAGTSILPFSVQNCEKPASAVAVPHATAPCYSGPCDCDGRLGCMEPQIHRVEVLSVWLTPVVVGSPSESRRAVRGCPCFQGTSDRRSTVVSVWVGRRPRIQDERGGSQVNFLMIRCGFFGLKTGMTV